jgi:hypothetical protein
MTSTSRKYPLLIVLLALFALAACGQKRSPAVNAVEAYVTALVEKKSDALTTHACAAWEEQALIELSSFGNVNTTLKDMKCQEAGSDGEYTLVKCQGQILADYNGEQQEFNLDRRTFRAILEGGEWRMCGYQSPQ